MPNTVIDTTTTPEGTKPACRAHHKIRSMAVSGGFLEGARLDFADGLNCIIGGRGTGKTTVLEFIRYLLGPMPAGTEGKPRARALMAGSSSALAVVLPRKYEPRNRETRTGVKAPLGERGDSMKASSARVAATIRADLSTRNPRRPPRPTEGLGL